MKKIIGFIIGALMTFIGFILGISSSLSSTYHFFSSVILIFLRIILPFGYILAQNFFVRERKNRSPILIQPL